MGVDVEVTDRGADRLEASLKGLSQELTVGIHEGAPAYPDGTPVASVGAAHEFGTSTIPQRSFLRAWSDSGGQSVIANVGTTQIGKVVDGAAAATVTAEVGQASVKGITERMDRGIFPPLSPATLANPNRNPDPTPLEDTLRLRDSITFEAAK